MLSDATAIGRDTRQPPEDEESVLVREILNSYDEFPDEDRPLVVQCLQREEGKLKISKVIAMPSDEGPVDILSSPEIAFYLLCGEVNISEDDVFCALVDTWTWPREVTSRITSPEQLERLYETMPPCEHPNRVCTSVVMSCDRKGVIRNYMQERGKPETLSWTEEGYEGGTIESDFGLAIKRLMLAANG